MGLTLRIIGLQCRDGGEGGAGGRTHFFFFCLRLSNTDHASLRDGVPVVLPIATSSMLGALITFFPY